MYFRAVGNIVVFGPGPQFKGGISNFTVSLCRALDATGKNVHLISWTHQYPSIIPRDFRDRASKRNPLEGTRVQVEYLTNYNNPLSWRRTVDRIVALQPEKVIFQWAIAIQGLPMGYIAKHVKARLPETELLFDVHNVVQKETGSLDKRLTRYALLQADTYIMHGEITISEFRDFLPDVTITIDPPKRILGERRILKLYHPIYDIFEPNPQFNRMAEREKLGLGDPVFLFFGFIRKYKGLHHAIEAFARIAPKYPKASLLIAGESFWNTVDRSKWSVRVKSLLFKTLKRIFIRSTDQEKDYQPLELIGKLGLEHRVVVVNRFIANEEVHRFFQVSDAVVNFYEYATPSGVESIAYNFELPILATRVGHFAFAIKDGVNGYLAEADSVESMALAMEKIIESPISAEKIREVKKKMGWDEYAHRIID